MGESGPARQARPTSPRPGWAGLGPLAAVAGVTALGQQLNAVFHIACDTVNSGSAALQGIKVRLSCGQGAPPLPPKGCGRQRALGTVCIFLGGFDGFGSLQPGWQIFNPSILSCLPGIEPQQQQ